MQVADVNLEDLKFKFLRKIGRQFFQIDVGQLQMGRYCHEPTARAALQSVVTAKASPACITSMSWVGCFVQAAKTNFEILEVQFSEKNQISAFPKLPSAVCTRRAVSAPPRRASHYSA